jgi:UDP-2-acetamido-2,6-beta-L-arabino-hexul-4-ose reductase
MKTVLVTGASGFIGLNLCAELQRDPEITLLRYEKSNTAEDLRSFIGRADFIFHLAGVNRPKNDVDYQTGNTDLTKDLLALVRESGNNTPVLLTSSIQAQQDNPYGRSKKAAEQALTEYTEETGAIGFIYRLPNVFGKWCRPNYNSVVATFCNNIANNLDITINDPEAEVTLVYIDDVVREFISSMNRRDTMSGAEFIELPKTYTINLAELSDKLHAFKESRNTLIMPNLEEPLNRYLYATFTSYFDEKDFSYALEMKHDNRGWLSEFIKSQQAGQIFISRTKPGISRGNHWHHTKIEKFLVVDGDAEIKFRNLRSKEVLTYTVSGAELKVLDIPAGYVHSITNTGTTDLLTIFWADELLNPDAPDTYPLEV